MEQKFQISLASARVNAGLTQQDVCKSLNVSNTTICKWENYKCTPSAVMALKLSELYKIPIEFICFTKGV